jgi:membrane protease YdiL (CAAX protease family)
MNEALIDRHDAKLVGMPRLAVFLIATFTTTWLAFLPMILGGADRESALGNLLLLLGIGAPSITAFLVSAVIDGREGIRRMWRGGRRWRVGGAWYAAVLLVPGLANGAAWTVAAALGLQTPFNPWLPALISGLLAGILEEYGWSGFAFPILQARYGLLRAGAAMGVIVAVWHLPFFLLPGTTQSVSSFPLFLLTLMAARIIFGWVYNGSGGSILLTVLLHASGNAWSETLGRGPATVDAPGLTETLVYSAAAAAVLLTTRRRARAKPDPATPPAEPAPMIHRSTEPLLDTTREENK